MFQEQYGDNAFWWEGLLGYLWKNASTYFKVGKCIWLVEQVVQIFLDQCRQNQLKVTNSWQSTENCSKTYDWIIFINVTVFFNDYYSCSWSGTRET